MKILWCPEPVNYRRHFVLTNLWDCSLSPSLKRCNNGLITQINPLLQRWLPKSIHRINAEIKRSNSKQNKKDECFCPDYFFSRSVTLTQKFVAISKIRTFSHCINFVVSLLHTGSASLVQLLTVQFCFMCFNHLCQSFFLKISDCPWSQRKIRLPNSRVPLSLK